ncbi:hypothetical protein [Adhaeribacter rhizoryzae]|uniref:Uncharacterized protein n=1 Tax=Adhaeribacter rhizoryzae TaxID=2607907 RepID=A0A5M6D767_9BACT|nr:hypothetical protein [Adhaeribacter rhizoryzae]KAA5543371.1 hypothetical protein F0145_17170 [Adhaeribacter rhizoryzae]
MKHQKIIETIGATTSLSIGLPMGIAAMVLFALYSVMITGESMFLFGWFFSNTYSTLALLMAFIIILYFAGKMLARDIYAKKDRIRVTFKYSILVNSIIWPAFFVVHLITKKVFDLGFGVITPLTLAVISILFTPFTVGLLIHKAVAKKIKNILAQ